MTDGTDRFWTITSRHLTYLTVPMRERITFIRSPDGDLDAKSLTVSKTSVQIKALKASREERLTLSAHELPQEVRCSLSQFQS